MARKNPFANVMSDTPTDSNRAVLDYTIRGASKSILNSIDEMAARADKLLEGETVIELDPDLVMHHSCAIALRKTNRSSTSCFRQFGSGGRTARSWCGLTPRIPSAIWWCSGIDVFERQGRSEEMSVQSLKT